MHTERERNILKENKLPFLVSISIRDYIKKLDKNIPIVFKEYANNILKSIKDSKNNKFIKVFSTYIEPTDILETKFRIDIARKIEQNIRLNLFRYKKRIVIIEYKSPYFYREYYLCFKQLNIFNKIKIIIKFKKYSRIYYINEDGSEGQFKLFF